MPQAIPILISLAISIALSLVESVLTKAFAPKQKKPTLGFDDRTDSNFAPSAPQEFVFGDCRKGGTIVFRKTTTDRQNLWMVIALAGHQSQAVTTLWLGNEQMFINSDGTVASAKYGTNVFCYVHLGSDTQTVDTNLQAVFPTVWTDEHRLRGITYIVLNFLYSATLFAQGVQNPSAYMKGYNQITDPRTGLTGLSANPLLCARAFLMSTVFGLSATEDEFDDDAIVAGANTSDEQVELPQYKEHFTLSSADTVTINTTVNTLNFVHLDDTAFATGDGVRVYSTGTMPAPLVSGTLYYAINTTKGNGNIQLATTFAGAFVPTIIDITTAGTGTISAVRENSEFSFLGPTTTFTASAATDLLTLTDYIAAPGGSGGEFSEVRFSSTTTLPAPLTNTDRFFVQFIVGVKTSAVYDTTFTAINLTSAGTGTHTMTVVGQVPSTMAAANIDVPSSTIVLTSSAILNPRYAGRPLEMHYVSGTTALPTPLIDDTIYYMIPVDDTHFRLALSRADALDGIYINILDIGSGSQWTVISQDIPADEATNLLTGTAVQIRASDHVAGTLFTPFATGTTYYVITQGRGIFALAASLADALAGTQIGPTSVGTDANVTYEMTVMFEPRYACNGSWDASQEYGEILRGILTSCAGRFVPPGDVWHLYAGAWSPPLTTLDLGDVRSDGSIKIQTRLSRRDASNSVSGTYISSLNFDLPADFPVVSFSTFVTEDGGDILPLDVIYPFTISKWCAVRLAIIDLLRSRFQRTLEWPGDLSLLELTVTDVVLTSITSSLDLNNVYFEINSLEIGIESANDNEGPIPAMDFVLREVDPGIYDDAILINGRQ